MDEEKTLDLETVDENLAQVEALEKDEAKTKTGDRYVHIFEKPVCVGANRQEVTELVFDWAALTGADHNISCHQAMNHGWTVVIREFTPPYLTSMAVRACTLRNEKGQRVLRYDDLERLPMKDMTKIQDEARNFLRQSEL